MSDATLKEVWRERDAWAREARVGKEVQERARLLALTLGVAGALLGALAGIAEETAWIGAALGLASAVSIALGGYFGRELLTPDRETRWARARILAEALQRECWRFLMHAPPYDGSHPPDALRKRAAELVSNVGLERASVSSTEEVQVPTPTGVQDYIELRALSQAQWYENRAATHRGTQTRYRRATLALGATAVVLGVVGATFTVLLGFVPVITTATAALVAWIQGARVGSLVSLYQETSTQLRLHIAHWRDAAERGAQTEEERRAAEVALVEYCETVMARENGSWRAEWLDEKSARETLVALERVQQAAQGARPPEAGGRNV